MSVEELKNKATVCIKAKQYSEAVDYLSQAIELDPNNSALYGNRSVAYLRLNEHTEALNDSEKMIQLDPNNPKSFLRKANALVSQGKLTDAKAAFEIGLNIDPDHPQCLKGLLAVNKALTQSSTPSTPSPNLPNIRPEEQAAVANVFAGLEDDLKTNPKLAHLNADPAFHKKFEEVLSNPSSAAKYAGDPQMQEMMQFMISKMMNAVPDLGKRVAQNEYAQKVAKSANIDLNNPGSSPSSVHSHSHADGEKCPVDHSATNSTSTTQYNTQEEEELSEEDLLQQKANSLKDEGNSLFSSGKIDEAIAKYEEALATFKHPIYYSNIAACFMKAKKYENAVDACKKGIEMINDIGSDFTTIGKVYARLGRAYAKLNMWAEACDALQTSLDNDRQRKVVLDLKKFTKAKKTHEIEAYYDEDKAIVAKQEGDKHFTDGNFELAIESYTESIKRNPKPPAIYSNRAFAYIKLARWQYAMEDCEKCLSIDPTFWKAYLRKGNIEIFLKKYTDARESFTKGLVHKPGHPLLLKGLQDVQKLVYEASTSSEVDETQVQEALKDPKIVAIINHPVMRQVLDDLQKDPSAAQKHLADPEVVKNLQILQEAGIIRLGGPGP